MIYVESRRRKIANIEKEYLSSKIIDITSKAEMPYKMLSPFYPHGNIPIPFSKNTFAQSVEGIWQGLKVFENSDVDFSKFSNDKMKDIKRTVRKYGKPNGHRKGVKGVELINYIEARKQIYLPAYFWVLENKLQKVLAELRKILENNDLVLLDYETNGDILNTKKPLSHAYLVKYYLENRYPIMQTDKFPIIEQLKEKSKNQKSKQLKLF